MSTTPSEPKIRTRTRKIGVASKCESQENTENPEAAKLRTVLSMVAENRSQEEIANHFGCDVRTVRRWIKKGRVQQLAVYHEFDPEEEIAATLFHLGELRAEAASIGRAAIESGDLKLALRTVEQMRRILESRISILAKLGHFDAYQFEAESTKRDREGTRSLIIDAARDVFALESKDSDDPADWGFDDAEE